MPSPPQPKPPSPPRARHPAPPPPFTVPIPPLPAKFALAEVAPTPAPPSPGAASVQLDHAHYRNAVHEVQSVLYGGRGRDREEIERVVAQLYDGGAAFENPLTLARGRTAIGDMFALLALVPGTMWSEMGDVTEAAGYDGNRLLVFTHTLHISLLPFLDSENVPYLPGMSTSTPSLRRSYSFFSLPSTPYPQTPSASHPSLDPATPTNDPDGGAGPPTPGIFTKTVPAFTQTRWPAQSLLAALNPRSIASALTTLHLKLHTRLLFNEDGRIIAHEDLWGIKELVEGVFPIAGHLYAVNRQGIAWVAGMASRALLGRKDKPKDEESQALEQRKDRDLEKAFVTPPAFRRDSLALPPSATSSPLQAKGTVLSGGLGGGALDGPPTLPSNGLGLVDAKAVPTTMAEEE
ncbi:hypothetical protein JCM10207_005276 [Rhodosporidiobolus poonsookiae]